MILEQLDPRGRVTHRMRLPATPITVGRAYDNDVILDDPYVEPHHLRIAPNEDGRIDFIDLSSVNGTWDQRLHWRVVSGVVRSGLELRVGRTVLRFAGPELAVPAAIPDPAAKAGVEHYLLNPRVAALFMVVAVAAAGTEAYLASSGDFTGTEFITPGLAGLLAGAIWAGCWAFANRLVAHRFRFLAHLGWVSLIAIGGLLVQLGAQWLEFFLPNARVEWLGLAADFGLGAALLAGHLWLVTEWPAKRRWRTAALATAVVATVVGLLASDQVVAKKEGPAGGETLKPVSGRLVPARTIDEFFHRARNLKAEVDRLAEDDDGR